MKRFSFDQQGVLTVVETAEDGEVSRQVNPEQLAVHLPMFVAEMSGDELLQAQSIIKGL